MNQEEPKTDWVTHDNFIFLLHIYNIPMGLFEEFMFYLNKILIKHKYFENDSNMSMDDSFISFKCDNSYYMQDENEEYCTFQYIDRKIYIIKNIGTRFSIKCGYIDNYPEDIIPNFLNILKLSFRDLKFIDNSEMIQIWNLNSNSIDFIQHLFLIIRNVKNNEFNFVNWVKSRGVENRKENKENEFSSETKILIRENANYCCESCGNYQQLYGDIDHINEHRFGGNKDPENGQLLCHVCHSIKTRMFSKTKFFLRKVVKKISGVSLKSSIKKKK